MSDSKFKEWTLVSFANLTRHGHLVPTIEAIGPELTEETKVIEYSEYEQLKAENLELDIQIARMDKALCSRDRKIKQLQEELEELQKTYDMESGGKY